MVLFIYSLSSLFKAIFPKGYKENASSVLAKPSQYLLY